MVLAMISLTVVFGEWLWEVASAKVHICPLYLMRHVRDGGQNYQTPVDVWVIHTLINLG